MKNFLRAIEFVACLLCLLPFKTVNAQNVGISSGIGFTPDASAGLDISYTSKGLLIPRVALTATNATGPITSPAVSLLVYNTATAGTSPNNVAPGYYYYSGTAWVMLSTSTQTANTWALTGNAGTTAGTNFLGTTDANDMVFKANNVERMRILSGGQVGIGTTTPASDFTLFQSTASGGAKGFRFAGNAISGPNSGTGFLFTLGYNANSNKQIWFGDPDAAGNAAGTFIRIAAGGTNLATLDAVAGDNSTRRYIALGSGGDATAGVMLGNDQNGTTAPKSFVWDNGNMAIGSGYKANTAPTDGLLVQGNVGIGTATPATKLHVFGANPLTLSGVVTGTSTTADSLLTITSGLVRKLPISTFTASGAAWSTTGNAGTSYLTNFLGTTDNNSLRLRTNNTQRFWLDSLGNAAVGTSPAFSAVREKFLVDAGITSSYNLINGRGNINNYLQLNIQNTNAGTSASSDVVATADNGNETTNFVNMGINSSAYTAGIFGGINDAYLYNTGGTATGGNLFIGTNTAGKSLAFLTGGSATTNERMRIDGTGNVGIGTTTPTTKLHVFGANPLTLSGVVTGTSTTADSLLTITSGLVRKLPISTFTTSGTAWATTGNAGTTAGTNFLGTTDANDMVFKANNVERMRILSGGQVGIGTTTPASDFTVFQSGGSGGAQGFRFAGNSIGGTNSGTGFLFTLGYNQPGNKQIWFGDADAAGVTTATFLRIAAGTTNIPTLDAISGTNGPRRFIALGNGGDANSGVIFGNDGNTSVPSSFVWDNGNMTIGRDWKANAAPANGLLVEGNVGIGTTSPSSTLVAQASAANNGILKLVTSTNNAGDQWWLGFGHAGSSTDANDRARVGVIIATGGGGRLFFTTGLPNAQAERMRIDETGNVGIGTTTPNSTLTLGGSLTVPLKNVSGNYTILATDYVVINTGTTAGTFTLPAANSCTGRVYRLVNQSTGTITLSPAVYTANATTTTTLANTFGTNAIMVISDGTNWRVIGI